MLTAAVRDLHRWYPGRFLTDVRTACADLWENNPHITPLSDHDLEVEVLDCSYPLIDRANETPYHCLHGFIEFFNQRLQLAIKPTAFKGDIHLSAQEKAWYSQVHEITGEDTPFWIVAAGGKYDVTIKWWQSERYQAVIDHFNGKIQFVQVGQVGHYHPRLEGVIDLRGKTSMRQLVRLVYHSQGVLCSVTALMHLAAAVETRSGCPPNRACVVVAGGREPAHWEAYPDHQFIHTNGALSCCLNGGCWKDRALPLRDGDERDRAGQRCLQVVGRIPRCMDMITPQAVIHRIETYFSGAALQYLSAAQQAAGGRGVRATARNPYNRQPLNLHNAGMACDAFVSQLPAPAAVYHGRGIVIAGGGVSYFTCAWVCIQMLRRLGCSLPIEFWHLGEREMDEERSKLLADLSVKCIDACEVRKKFPARMMRGWELKPYSILHSSFSEVLFLDADNVPVVDPSFLFDTPEFRNSGAVFWPDFEPSGQGKAAPIWKSCGMRPPREREFETGQILVDKHRCWRALRLSLWFNENSDFYYRYLYGDKETFHLAFRKLRQPYSLVPHPIDPLSNTMCQHDFEGRRIFQHRNRDKWDLLLHNREIKGFWFEKECRTYLLQLRTRWDGGLKSARVAQVPPRRIRRARAASKLRIEAVMISFAGRDELRRRTLENLASTDWLDGAVQIQLEPRDGEDAPERKTRCAYEALKRSLERDADYVLLLEDDLEFNRHLNHNLRHWVPLRDRLLTLAGLYNPRVRELACDMENNARIVDPESIFESQAFIISRPAVKHLVRHWNRVDGRHDVRIPRLASRLKSPVYYHAPSLVQPIRGSDDALRPAIDFDPAWRA
jgi:ADP-heptose:LPS heptosyltransferase